MSPHVHDRKQNSPNSNAREFIPSQQQYLWSGCPSNRSPVSIVPVQFPPSHMKQVSAPHNPYAPPVGMYSADYKGVPMMPIYADCGPFFGYISAGFPTVPPCAEPLRLVGAGLGMQDHGYHISTCSDCPQVAPQIVIGGQQHHPYLSDPPYCKSDLPPIMQSSISAADYNISSVSDCSDGGPVIGSATTCSMPAAALLVVPPRSLLTGREDVSRALLLSSVPTELSDYLLKQELELWGSIRTLELERRHEGLVTTHYFDLRHSMEALKDIQHQHLVQQQCMQQQMQNSTIGHGQVNHVGLELQQEQQNSSKVQPDSSQDDDRNIVRPARGLIGGKAVWAQYTVPIATGMAATNLEHDSRNQGTLVVFNLDADMGLDDLRAAFEAHGAVKEIRETPAKRQHKFVEFYDIRDAARALAALDGHEMGGNRVTIEFSRPGGQFGRACSQAQAQVQTAHHVGGGSLESAVPVVPNRLDIATMPGAIQGQPMHIYLGWGADLSMSPPQSMSIMAASLGVAPPQYLSQWANVQHVLPGHPTTPLGTGTLVQHTQLHSIVGHDQFQTLPYQQIQERPPSPVLGVPVDFVPIGRESGRNRQFENWGYKGRPCSPGLQSTFHTVSGIGRGGNGVRGGTPGRGSGEPTGRRRRRCPRDAVMKIDLTCLRNSIRDDASKQVLDESRQSERTGVTPNPSSPQEHATYEFNPDQAVLQLNNDRPRTTLMIKNIPNKYTQSMLLALLDQHCVTHNKSMLDPNEPQSGYDFVYLPIDFKNRCNLGYAFVNFTSVQATVKFYESFHTRHWEVFQCGKICQIRYARVQGRAALEEHFRNSWFPCTTDEYLPLLFSTPRTGIARPPPIVAAGPLTGRALMCGPGGEAGS